MLVALTLETAMSSLVFTLRPSIVNPQSWSESCLENYVISLTGASKEIMSQANKQGNVQSNEGIWQTRSYTFLNKVLKPKSDNQPWSWSIPNNLAVSRPGNPGKHEGIFPLHRREDERPQEVSNAVSGKFFWFATGVLRETSAFSMACPHAWFRWFFFLPGDIGNLWTSGGHVLAK